MMEFILCMSYTPEPISSHWTPPRPQQLCTLYHLGVASLLLPSDNNLRFMILPSEPSIHI